ncbi:MAG: GAF domain-containing protein [Candidatus Sulfotelmatobacter sp.]|jgi:putative methionine-R-sulfoxide reductase with GAF domain
MNKPVLDQQTFEKLLEAAYVIQEHNRRMRELGENLESQSEKLREQESANQVPPPRDRDQDQDRDKDSEDASRPSDYTLTLAEIVEAQHQIQMRHLDLDKAVAVVAERVARITGASGAAIGILEGKMVRYRAGAGAPALPPGTEVPLKTAICNANVRTGQVIRTEDVNTEFLFDPEPCRQRGILSLVAVPIYHDGSIVGALELYFDKVRGFAEQDIHTCQLMAGLVTEAIGQDAGLALKKSMAEERSSMLAAIERLQPNLAALAEDKAPAPASTNGGGASAPAAAKATCWKCNSTLLAEEQFCGKCGAPRASEGESSSMQSKLASAWHMQTGGNASAATMPSGNGPIAKAPRPVGAQPVATQEDRNALGVAQDSAGNIRGQLSSLEVEESTSPSPQSLNASAIGDAMPSPSSESQLEEYAVSAASTALAKPHQDVVWSSAASARDFLESLSTTRQPSALARFWRARRGDFYLAVALILVVVVIRWGIWSNHSVAAGRGAQVSASANQGKAAAPDASLSMFDKLLINLGLAEPPEAPEYKGNPDIQVWVDLHTALYYCPGSDLYGKTPQGKMTSQREAQLDQFEPASRKACE